MSNDLAAAVRSRPSLAARLTVAVAGLAVAGLAVAGIASPVRAGIVELDITASEPFAGGHVFGSAGAYVRMRGVAKGELDPGEPHNRIIVDLDKAPRNAHGKVAYETDAYILAPADAAKRSGTLFYEVVNRGRKLAFTRLQDSSAKGAAANDPAAAADAGVQPLLLERGYVLVWSGWEPAAPTADGGLAIRVPTATIAGDPIIKRVREEIQFGTRGGGDGSVARLSYPATLRATAETRLAWRDRESEARHDLQPTEWTFVGDRAIKLLPEGTTFKPRRIYELWYEAHDPPVTGIGFAATRDLVSFLRYAAKDAAGHLNPLAPTSASTAARTAKPNSAEPAAGITHTLGFGISQSGRYLRQHIELGMNEDEAGRRVFDGILTHAAGIGRVFANEAFAEPGRTATQHEDRFYPEGWFPFSYTRSADPFTKKTGMLLRNTGTDPLVIESNTSSEYWQKGASLLHTNPAGLHDLAEAPKARRFLISGTQHAGSFGSATDRGACANPRNPHSASPLLRALLVVLDDWVVHGVKPPASRVPHVLRHTAVRFADLKLPKLPGMSPPQTDNQIGLPESWVYPPVKPARIYGTLLPAVDADGNEVDGLRSPDQQVPIATMTGWNVYQGLETELCDRDGSWSAFARTAEQRHASADPRPSLTERYGTHAKYVAKVKAAAESLVHDRLLLPRDAAGYVAAAEKVEF